MGEIWVEAEAQTPSPASSSRQAWDLGAGTWSNLEVGLAHGAEELVAAGGQEGRERGEQVRGDGEHQCLRGGGEEGVRRRLVRPPRRGGERGEVEQERVERERGGGRWRGRGREERAPFPRPRREGGLVREQPPAGGLHRRRRRRGFAARCRSQERQETATSW